MIGIVRVALARPYTFVVMAVLILIAGVSAAVRTPTDRVIDSPPETIQQGDSVKVTGG